MGCNPTIISAYQTFLADSELKYSLQYQIHSSLRFFYRWCFKNGLIQEIPYLKGAILKPAVQITICTESQHQKLFTFIKNPNSNPEQAFLLALLLVWAFKNEDLRFSKIDFHGKQIKLILPRRKPKKTKLFNREQVLILPSEPKWFYSLQQRF